MKRIFLLFLFGYLAVLSGFGQVNVNNANRILFQGFVLDASTFAPISNSQIMINRSFSTVSKNDGTFSFYVNRKDTVEFNSLGYKPSVLFISDTLSGTEFIAGIYMKSDTVSIGGVVIVPRFSNLRSSMMSPDRKTPSIMDNARYNVAIGAYQGKNGISSLGDPESNYQSIKHKQSVEAYERGGIPSDKIVGLDPLLLIPLAYQLLVGFPAKTPQQMKPDLTPSDLDLIQKKYFEMEKQKK